MRRKPITGTAFIGYMAAAAVLMTLWVARYPALAAGDDASEAARVVSRLLAKPEIKPAPGFKAKILVPPGELYDPLQMAPYGDRVWINDDGGESGNGGGRLVAVDRQGKVSVLVPPRQMLPDVGMDVAPVGFGNYGGQVFVLTQPANGEKGLWANHLIQRVDPRTRALQPFCTLPPSGSAGHGIAGAGSALWFGPPHSPFGQRIFAVTTQNDMVYQASIDGKCAPFADFSNYGVPLELTFTPDGQWMLVSVTPTNAAGMPDAQARRGLIMKVSPKGEIKPKPLVWGIGAPGGMAFAPPDFKWYGGQLFFTDLGNFEVPIPMTQRLRADGAVMRLSKGGEPKPVASGFVNPLHLRFVGKRLWVADINGDFIDGRRELPDGFIVEISTLPTL